MHRQISLGTLDAPSWDLIRVAKLAARIYAPLGTSMSLGDYVRVVRTFLDAFKASLPLDTQASEGSTGEAEDGEIGNREDLKLTQLREALTVTLCPPPGDKNPTSIFLVGVPKCVGHCRD